ncbi:Oligopeptide transport ATP-binding protein OppD [Pseudonocardia sp. Ae406_Ps2]|uniref:ABC transporter ATP-binding protein n=1 Tax=unclassified Pseudonocardia TaxID=2619320 RepID=UPI00094B585E|nr:MULTISPECIES: ABC transporter ATP-binding protein [unclassified Pseudonocardia]OLM01294.1 Oligopeptide transport ATP-binding protein OppD [Pseudonocardia sp. Ae406_Ps2]OLM06909.1 Oligopeptide transport ATP-binding protein OppD [Pseudonocardia sp. Ae331_Ps2]OLM14085.1 Oligopeptide transport ATP-binding protein OppD [Pseudonocardia sp. Ae505_Ps2]OLM22867.1 Oligopeptide transport ATP-binding protein OppD [Pseudonocardia sp. Ae706_Ps2]OLM31263.1 Oligopeptide transport ATP-binding protein OppD [
MTLLEITDLTVRFGDRPVVDGVSLHLGAGERLGLIGASGSGKSLTALAAVGLAPEEAVVSGSVRLDGREILGLPDGELAPLRGGSVGVVFQEPQTALDPLMRVGSQVAGPVRRLRGTPRRAAAERAVELLTAVGLPDPEHLARAYPHQLSGGQRQRVGIAIALAGEPALLIADEPTTALDVTVQADILALLDRLVRERGTALLFISHDLAVVAQVADRVAVLAEGRLREEGPLAEVLRAPAAPATRALLDAYRASAWNPQEVRP